MNRRETRKLEKRKSKNKSISTPEEDTNPKVCSSSALLL
jgi:hypothetical protein